MREEEYVSMHAVEDRHWWFAARRRIVGTLLEGLLPQSAEILEVGCGTGGNFPIWKQFGAAVALEPNSVARSYAQSRNMADVYEGVLPSPLPAEIATRKFDLVAALDVLEHVGEDAEAARVLYGLVRRGGFALFTVPAYKMLWSGHDTMLQHKRRYTRAQMVGMVSDAGFRIVYATYYNTLLFPLMLVMRVVAAVMGDRVPRGDRIPAFPGANTMLRTLFEVERAAIRHQVVLPFGGSILVLTRKD